MKKFFIPVLAAILILAAAGCGNKEAEPDAYTLRYQSVGEIIDTGELKAVCPKGWTSIDAYDFEQSSAGPVSYILEFVKGGASAADGVPFLRIVRRSSAAEYTGNNKDLYKEAYDVQPYSAGDYTWNGYSTEVNGQRITWLSTKAGEVFLEAWLYSPVEGENKAGLTDADVSAVFDSIVAAVPETKN